MYIYHVRMHPPLSCTCIITYFLSTLWNSQFFKLQPDKRDDSKWITHCRRVSFGTIPGHDVELGSGPSRAAIYLRSYLSCFPFRPRIIPLCKTYLAYLPLRVCKMSLRRRQVESSGSMYALQSQNQTLHVNLEHD